MRVAILGAGYAGITLARELEDDLPTDVDLVVVNDEPTHLVLHELHRAIRRPSIVDTITVPLDEVFDRAEVVTARIANVDTDAREIAFEDDRDPLDYDYAAVCLGSETAFYDLPGVDEYGTPLKRVGDAERIRSDFLDVCAAGGRVVVGGAGLSGIQVVGELHALAVEEGARDDVDIVLSEQFDSVAPNFPENFQEAVRDELEAREVEIRTNTTITEATADELKLEDGELPYDQFVWTGGIRGPDAVGGDRLEARGDLRVTRETFVVGDTGKIVDADGQSVPASASAALREARTVAKSVTKLVDHDRRGDPDEFEPHLEQYRFNVPGWLVSVGDGAVAQLGPTVLTGTAAKAMKTSIGAGHLTSVGAVTRAADLVEEEFGGSWQVDERDEFADELRDEAGDLSDEVEDVIRISIGDDGDEDFGVDTADESESLDIDIADESTESDVDVSDDIEELGEKPDEGSEPESTDREREADADDDEIGAGDESR